MSPGCLARALRRFALALLAQVPVALACLVIAASASPAGAGDVLVRAGAVSTATEGARTRLSLTLSGPVAARAWVMARPDRVIVDMPEVEFHLGPEAGRHRDGLIASFRYGLFAPGRSRLVVDLSGPALAALSVAAPREGDGAVLLTLELTRTDPEGFRRAAAAEAGRPAPAQPAPAGPRTDRRPLVVIDPGHGGTDPGARAGRGVVEKDVVFGFARVLKERLEASGRYRVSLTRDRDVFVALGERVRIARAAQADLMISIHADSISAAPHVRGLTVYTGSERASDQESARLADAENRADAVAGVEASTGLEEVADILQDLTLRETRGFSHRFAKGLVKELGSVVRLNANPLRQAGFRVLRALDVPSVLIELGYLSSQADIDLLTSDAWRARTSDALIAAIHRYFEMRVAGGPGGPVAPVSP